MNSVEFTDNLNKMTMADYTDVLAKYKVDAFDNPAETEYFAKYLLNGERKGLVGIANVAEARVLVSKLFADMPHLKVKYNDPLKAALTMTNKVKPKAKTQTGDKVTKPKAAKVNKPVYQDGMVFFRADRNKWMAVLGGKPVAARPTKEKALEFLAKKGIEGYVVEGV